MVGRWLRPAVFIATAVLGLVGSANWAPGDWGSANPQGIVTMRDGGSTTTPTRSGAPLMRGTSAGAVPADTTGAVPADTTGAVQADPAVAVPPGPATTEPATSDALIQDAVNSSQISPSTALVYRVRADFGDPRVPIALQGAVSEDEATLVQAYWSRSALPPADAAAVAPYLDRPTAPAEARLATTDPGYRLAASGSGPSDTCAGDGWTSLPGRNPFRVWATCTGAYQAALENVASALDSLWGPMTAVMGPPHPDDGTGGDSRIDVYLVDDAVQCAPGREPCYRLPPEVGGRAVPADPTDGVRTSAFLVLPRLVATDQQMLRSLVAHEFFHVLQFAHNARGMFLGPVSQWFVEASADWAQTAFARNSADRLVYQPLFVSRFQRLDVPLNSENSPTAPNAYQAFIWPYFMQQENGGDPGIVGAAWRALESAGDFNSADRLLNGVFSFSGHFADFAFRNLNRMFFPNSPIVPEYADLDPTFPTGAEPTDARRHPVITVPLEPPGVTAIAYPEHLDDLSSHYWVLAVPPEVRQIDLDLGGLSGGDLLADAAVLVGHGCPFTGDWERRTLPAGRTTWCRDNPDDNISLIFLVLSNGAFSGGRPVSGSLQAVGAAPARRPPGRSVGPPRCRCRSRRRAPR